MLSSNTWVSLWYLTKGSQLTMDDQKFATHSSDATNLEFMKEDGEQHRVDPLLLRNQKSLKAADQTLTI
jgi:hypothetical protein